MQQFIRFLFMAVFVTAPMLVPATVSATDSDTYLGKKIDALIEAVKSHGGVAHANTTRVVGGKRADPHNENSPLVGGKGVRINYWAFVNNRISGCPGQLTVMAGTTYYTVCRVLDGEAYVLVERRTIIFGHGLDGKRSASTVGGPISKYDAAAFAYAVEVLLERTRSFEGDMQDDGEAHPLRKDNPDKI